MKFKKKNLIPLILIGMCIPAVWHLLYPGYFSVHDDMHPAWVLQMARAIESGQFPPRWAPDLSYGYGYPLFHFIYPLPYYLSAFFYFLGANLIWATKLTYIVSVLGSAFSMYLLARRYWSVNPALISALVYVYTPYRAVNIYVRGALGESLAWVFIPLVFLSLDKVSQKLSPRNLALVGFSLAGLLLTHNIAAMATAPFIALFTLWLIFKSKHRLKTAMTLLLSSATGLLASAYFWLPALVDKSLMVEDAIFNFQDHFPFLHQLIKPSWGYGASLWGPHDGMSFQIGIFNLIAVGVGGIFLVLQFIKQKQISSGAFLTIGAFFFTVYIMNIRSSWIWANVPLMNYFQFPWRLLILTTFFTSLLAGFTFARLKSYFPNYFRFIFLTSAGLVLLFNYQYFQPDKHLPTTQNDIIEKYFAINPLNLQSPQSELYATIQEEYLRLPKHVPTRPTAYPFDRISTSNPLTQISWSQISPTTYKITTQGPKTEITLETYYFPLWQVDLNGKTHPSYSGTPHGKLVTFVPQGHHQLYIYLQETSWRQWVTLTSSVTLIILSLLLFKKRFTT